MQSTVCCTVYCLKRVKTKGLASECLYVHSFPKAALNHDPTDARASSTEACVRACLVQVLLSVFTLAIPSSSTFTRRSSAWSSNTHEQAQSSLPFPLLCSLKSSFRWLTVPLPHLNIALPHFSVCFICLWVSEWIIKKKGRRKQFTPLLPSTSPLPLR